MTEADPPPPAGPADVHDPGVAALVADLRLQLDAARREAAAARESARHAHRDSARLVRLLTALARPASDTAALLTSALETISEAFAADVVCFVRPATPVAAGDAEHVVVSACGFPRGTAPALPVLPRELADAAPGAPGGGCGGWSSASHPLHVAGVAVRSGARLVLDPADAAAGSLLVLRGLQTAFTATELKMLQSLTERLCAALQACERRAAAEVLAAAGPRLTRHRAGDDLLAEAAGMLVALTGAEWAGVVEVRDGLAHLCAQSSPAGTDLTDSWPRRAEDLLGWQDLRAGRPHLCHDLAAVAGHPDRPPRSRVRTVLCVPVVAEGATQVLLYALHGTPSAFSRVTAEAVEQFSSGLSGALVSSRLHEALRLSEQSARHRASHDPLTGLANRALFREELERRLHPRRPAPPDQGPAQHPAPLDGAPVGGVGVLFCDLDGFKDVNDALGHDAGDQLLRQVADRLTAVVRAEDLVARLGGDEFVVLVDGVAEARSLEAVAERVLAALAAPFPLDGLRGGVEPVLVGASLGAAAGTAGERPEQRAGELLRAADAAMYQAKRAGGRRLVAIDVDVDSALLRT
ncbi:diguanylate cyclase domain-containing protein [Quadrisphaera sp. KR29]|uniref:diguanylate cyclase domain-containing protein n=1 Tax=Quadrisphaera sp. KR29 TaxID=3461391 RepID=UPI004044EDB4